MEDHVEARKPVKQSSAIQQNAHDELAVKLKSLREQCVELDMVERAQSRENVRETEINEYERRLCKAFLYQMEKRLGIRRKFLAQLHDKDIDEIDRYLFELSRKRRARWKTFLVCVPVLGWLILPTVFFDTTEYSVMSNYSHIRNVMKKYRGDEYFPYHKLHAIAEEKNNQAEKNL